MPEHDDLEERLRRAFRWVADGPPSASEDLSHTANPRRLPGGDDDGAFLHEKALPLSGRPSRRPLVLVAASVLLLVAVGVSVGLVVAGTRSPGSGQHQSSNTDAAAARARVISALGATTAAGNWNITYSYTQVPGGNSSTTTTVPPAMTCPTTDPPSTGSSCAVLVVPGSSAPNDENVTVTGTGVIDVNPKAMVTDADPSDFGPVTIRLDSTQLWELGSDDGGGLAPGPSVGSTPGQAISGFAGLVESTLGAREGAVAMLGIASPTGYLVLDEQEITSVAPTGQDTIDGKPVTEYRVSADASQLENDPSATAEELTTIRAAIAKLQSQGLSGTGTDVAVDAQGFIVQSITTYQFSDGGSVTVKADFSNFGCAGTVLMPGQVGPTTPPANCVSPDTPVSTPTSTTNATTTSSSPSTTSTTVATPTTIGIAPTLTTTPSSTGSSTTSTSIAGSSTTTTTTVP